MFLILRLPLTAAQDLYPTKFPLRAHTYQSCKYDCEIYNRPDGAERADSGSVFYTHQPWRFRHPEQFMTNDPVYLVARDTSSK